MNLEELHYFQGELTKNQKELLGMLETSESGALSYNEIGDKFPEFMRPTIREWISRINKNLEEQGRNQRIIYDLANGGQGAWGICLSQENENKAIVRNKILLSLKNYLYVKYKSSSLEVYNVEDYKYVAFPLNENIKLSSRPLGLIIHGSRKDLIVFPNQLQYDYLQLIFQHGGYIDSKIVGDYIRREIKPSDLQQHIVHLNTTLVNQLNLETPLITFTGRNGFQIKGIKDPRSRLISSWLNHTINCAYNYWDNSEFNDELIKPISLEYGEGLLKRNILLELVDLSKFENKNINVAFSMNEDNPFLLRIRNSEIKDQLTLEISRKTAAIIGEFFERDIQVRTLKYDVHERNEMRSTFTLFLNKLKTLGYNFEEGTGYAGRSKLIFPVIKK